MTTATELYAAIGEAEAIAADVYEAVLERADSIACVLQSSTCEGMRWTAQQNWETVRGLRERIEEALAAEPERAGDVLTQALVIVEQTREQTQRLATWASASWLGELVTETWAALVELVSDLAYELAGAIVVVGKAAAKSGLGWLLGGAAVAIGVAAAALRR